MVINPKKLVLRLLIGFALITIGAYGGERKVIRSSAQALSVELTVCSPLTTPYNACVVADATGHVGRAGLQSLIDQASAQYMLRPASLGPVRVTLPGKLTYSLDGTLKLKAGVHLVGTGANKPRLVSVGAPIDVGAWALTARTAAESFVPAASYTWAVGGDLAFHNLRCPAQGACDLEQGLADLDAHLRPTFHALCPDDACVGAGFRYFDVLRHESLCINQASMVAWACYAAIFKSEDPTIPTTDLVVPAYEYALRTNEITPISSVTADAVITIEPSPGGPKRLQSGVENVAIDCAPGPYPPWTRASGNAGFGASGILVYGGTPHDGVADVQLIDNEITGCTLGIYTFDAEHVQIIHNQIQMSFEPVGGAGIQLVDGGPHYARRGILDQAPSSRDSADNGIRIHGRHDRGMRIEQNDIGIGPGRGPGRGVHIHGPLSTAASPVSCREDLIVTGSHVRHAQDEGIIVEGCAHNLRIDNNKVDSVYRVWNTGQTPPNPPGYPDDAIKFLPDEGAVADRYTISANTFAGVPLADDVDGVPVIAGCVNIGPLTFTPLGQPPNNQVAIGRTVTFAPPAPSFTAGCSAAIAPQYALCSGPTTANCTLIVDFPQDAPLNWTPQTPGTRTFRLGARSRDAMPGDPWLAQTETVTINVAATLSSISCNSPKLSIEDGPVTGTVQIAPSTRVSCTRFTMLEYQLRARRVGSLFWLTTFDYSPSDTFLWNPATVDSGAVEFQIRYRRQGSNASYEGATTPKTYPF